MTIKPWAPPLTADGKWRISCAAFFATPILPPGVDVCQLHGERVAELTSGEFYDRAPRLPHAVYKWRDYDNQWWLMWCETASFKERKCKATIYRPIIRVKAGRAPVTKKQEPGR